jgi:ABC-type ATPase involved in cell division
MATHHKMIIDKYHKRVIELREGVVTKGGGLKEPKEKEEKVTV